MKLGLSSHTKVFAVAVVALSMALLAGGALQASNMGFKLNKVISIKGGFPVGTNLVALPYRNPYLTAADVCSALGLAAGSKVKQTNADNGAESQYTCGDVNPYSLLARVGLEIFDSPATVSGILVGSHAGGPPGVNIFLQGAVAGGPIGRNDYPVLYHGTAATAGDVCTQLSLDSVGGPGNVAHVQRINAANGAISDHDCGEANPFTLVLGEAVRVTNEPADHIGVVVPHF